jgi:hypothetical protein
MTECYRNVRGNRARSDHMAQVMRKRTVRHRPEAFSDQGNGVEPVGLYSSAGSRAFGLR